MTVHHRYRPLSLMPFTITTITRTTKAPHPPV
jgi:hypothetical protein